MAVTFRRSSAPNLSGGRPRLTGLAEPARRTALPSTRRLLAVVEVPPNVNPLDDLVGDVNSLDDLVRDAHPPGGVSAMGKDRSGFMLIDAALR